jgi:nucleoside-diphosphate-sugar epimerase
VTVKLGNTKPKRDYIHVDDVADAFVALVRGLPEGETVETFNICSGREETVAGLVEMMGDLLGVEVLIESDPTRFRKIDRLQQLGAPDKIASRRGWHARITLREALARIMTDLGHNVDDASASRAA